MPFTITGSVNDSVFPDVLSDYVCSGCGSVFSAAMAEVRAKTMRNRTRLLCDTCEGIAAPLIPFHNPQPVTGPRNPGEPAGDDLAARAEALLRTLR